MAQLALVVSVLIAFGIPLAVLLLPALVWLVEGVLAACALALLVLAVSRAAREALFGRLVWPAISLHAPVVLSGANAPRRPVRGPHERQAQGLRASLQ